MNTLQHWHDPFFVIVRWYILVWNCDASAKTGKTDMEKMQTVNSYRYIEMVFREIPDGGGYEKNHTKHIFKSGVCSAIDDAPITRGCIAV